MTNNLLTISKITNEALMVLENEHTFTSEVNRDYDDQFAVVGAKIGATVNVPVLKGHCLGAVFFIHRRTARDWSPEEVGLFEDVAERLRADLERARAEAAQRTVSAHLEAALASMSLSGVLCARHSMSTRSMYAEQKDDEGGAGRSGGDAADSQGHH